MLFKWRIKNADESTSSNPSVGGKLRLLEKAAEETKNRLEALPSATRAGVVSE